MRADEGQGERRKSGHLGLRHIDVERVQADKHALVEYHGRRAVGKAHLQWPGGAVASHRESGGTRTPVHLICMPTAGLDSHDPTSTVRGASTATCSCCTLIFSHPFTRPLPVSGSLRQHFGPRTCARLVALESTHLAVGRLAVQDLTAGHVVWLEVDIALQADACRDARLHAHRTASSQNMPNWLRRSSPVAATAPNLPTYTYAQPVWCAGPVYSALASTAEQGESESGHGVRRAHHERRSHQRGSEELAHVVAAAASLAGRGWRRRPSTGPVGSPRRRVRRVAAPPFLLLPPHTSPHCPESHARNNIGLSNSDSGAWLRVAADIWNPWLITRPMHGGGGAGCLLHLAGALCIRQRCSRLASRAWAVETCATRYPSYVRRGR